MPDRVSFYIDGYNLYCGLRDKYGSKWLWLDLGGVCRGLLKNGQELACIHYCTTKATRGHARIKRQHDYWRALSTVPKLQLHEGYHQPITKECPNCSKEFTRHEEKQTDSRIASLMVADAMANRADTLVVIGGDADHVPPVEVVRKECPKKQILVCWPPARRSLALLHAVGREFYIGQRLLRQNQFPASVMLPDGSTVSRPSKWSASGSSPDAPKG